MAPGTNAQNSGKHSLTNAESPRHPENLHEMHPASRGNYGLESCGGYTILPAESSLLELPTPSQQCTMGQIGGPGVHFYLHNIDNLFLSLLLWCSAYVGWRCVIRPFIIVNVIK